MLYRETFSFHVTTLGPKSIGLFSKSRHCGWSKDLPLASFSGELNEHSLTSDAPYIRAVQVASMKIPMCRTAAGAGTMVCTLAPAAHVFFGYPEKTKLWVHP
jgi:hypothetical protein